MNTFQPQSVNGFTFEIDASSYLYYANALNGDPYISTFRVSNTSGTEITDAKIELFIESMGTPVTTAWTVEIGSFASTPVIARDLALDFDAAALFDQLDTHPGRIVAKILQGESTLAETFWGITVLPANYWLPNLPGQYKTLAAFSQPNDPTLQILLESAASDLKSHGSAANWSGYQDLGHVDEMVKSIYESVQKQQIVYSDPPASWDIGPGQAIRSAQQILTEKLGTCLDTAILFSSLMERVGLYPVIVLIPGHAFVGYWTSKIFTEEGEHFRPQEALLPVSEMMNRLDLGYIRLFETTVVTQREMPIAFSEALDLGISNLTEHNALSSGASRSLFVDVVAARKSSGTSVHPLPVRVVRPDGTIEVIEYKPSDFTVGLLREQVDKALVGRKRPGTQISAEVPTMVKLWLDQLLDLSLRNPLINFRNPKSCVPLVTPRDSLGIIEDLLQQDKVFRLAANPFGTQTEAGEIKQFEIENDRGQAKRDTEASLVKILSEGILCSRFGMEDHASRLRKMVNAANSFQEETGSNGLFLALGMLRWSPKDGAEVDSPLILVPVRITSKNRGKEYFLSIDDAGITPNFSLVEKIKRELGIELPGLTSLALDQSGIDVDGTLTYVREELAKAGLNGFRVDEKAILGFFNFSSYRLWRDLLDNWQLFEKSPLVNHLINSPTESFKEPVDTEPDQDLDDLIAKLPIEADGSQATAVSKALAGHTFVLQGPPGTGKSQTIANLLAQALHEGKRVLFVAQKQDALQVVKDRLDRIGLGPFSLDLFDKASTTKAVREQLAAVIDISVSADTIGFETAVSEYDGTLPSLTGYREKLHSKNQFDESVYSARMKYLAVPGKEHLTITGDFIANGNPEDKESLVQATRSISTLGLSAGIASKNPWSLTGLVSQPSQDSLIDIKDSVSRALEAWDVVKANTTAKTFIETTPIGEDLGYLESLTLPNDFPAAVESSKTNVGQAALIDALNSLEQSIASIEGLSVSPGRLGSFDPDFWIGRAQLAIGGFSLMRNFKLKGIRKKVGIQLASNLAGDHSNLVGQLEQLKTAKLKLTRAAAAIERISGFRSIPIEELASLEFSHAALNQLKTIEKLAIFANMTRASGPQPHELMSKVGASEIDSLFTLLEVARKIAELLAATPESLSLWQGEKTFWQAFTGSLDPMYRDSTEYAMSQLTRWVELLGVIEVFRKNNLDIAAVELLSGQIGYENAQNSFLKGFYLRLLDNLVVTRGFNTFNEVSLNNSIRKLNDSHKEIRERLPRVLASELLERRGFDSSMRLGAIGDLMMTIKQAKRNLPLRTMLAKHWDIINQVTPLVLASPDSCVRFIDPSSTPFDLVVFDEASQIRVATAIGALGRAKSAVIVGDSQQMPPTSVAQSKNDYSDETEDEELSLAGEVESILSMCEVARVPEIMLTWHYRSDDEALIAFSNQKYYEGRLNTFPSPMKVTDGAGLKFENVGGQFIRTGQAQRNVATLGTNPEEAKAIIDEIASRLSNPETANDSIGVVTLNQPQQKLILELLQTSTNKFIADAMENGVGGEPIFVKNLETVQGSERDVILLSVAFSPKPDNSSVLPLNFGPINLSGGHRRLNVAITRARKYVKIFASFDPSLLIASNPTSQGLRHLSEYLAMAKADDKSEFDVIAAPEPKVDRHRRDVLTALRDAGIPVIEEIGMSEFKVDIALQDPKDPNKSLVGILLDGERWNERKTVSDRDSLPVNLLLNRMGWQSIDRIWLPAWIRDRSGEIERITELYERVKSQPRKTETKKPKQAAAPLIVEHKTNSFSESQLLGDNPVDRMLAETKTWSQLQVQVVGNASHLDYLHNAKVQETIRGLVEQLTNFEGPVSPERLAKYIGSCFGFSRLVGNRVAAINGMGFPKHRRDEENFLYPANVNPKNYDQWQRGEVSSPRKIEEISLHEIGNAIESLAKVAQGVRTEQLHKEVVSTFGIQKLTTGIQQRLDKALRLAVTVGKVKMNGEYVVSAR